MTIIPLLANGAFDPETTEVLGSAFETAWQRIKASGSPLAVEPDASSTRDHLARCIIEIGRHGEKNPERLVERALGRLVELHNFGSSAAKAS